MPFIGSGQVRGVELMPGIVSRLSPGKNLMLSLLDMKAGAVVPPHNHPHEQAGIVIEGRLEFEIGDEKATLGPGDMFIVPPDVAHGVHVMPERDAVVLDVFSPPREDYLAKLRQE